MLLALSIPGCAEVKVEVQQRIPVDAVNSPCGPSGFGHPYYVNEHFLEWTPDGSSLIFDSPALPSLPPYHKTAIWIVDAQGTQTRMVVDANPGHFFVYGFHADLSPDGSRIVYSTCEYPTEGKFLYSERENYHYEIAVMNLGGDGKQRLTENHDLDHYPTWSPDGSHIAFLSSRGHSNDIGADLYTMGADGSHVRLVSATQGGVAYVPPIWSPDGERLAFAIYEEPWPVRTALYTVRVDGSEASRIADIAVVSEESGGPPTLMSWSPDGERLAFVMADEEGESGGVYTVRPDGSDLRQVIDWQTPEWSWIVSQVSWSPDGSMLLIVSAHQIFVIHTDGTDLHRFDIIEHRNAKRLAAWSPDSSRIAVYMPGVTYNNSRVPFQLFVVVRDGTDRRDLIRLDDDGNLVPANLTQ